MHHEIAFGTAMYIKGVRKKFHHMKNKISCDEIKEILCGYFFL